MKSALSLFLALSVTVLFCTPTAMAGGRYSRHYDYGYRPYVHDHHYSYSHRYHNDAWLPLLGVGLLTGAVVGSMVATPPRTVYYTPPRTVYYPAPAVTVYTPPASPPAATAGQEDVVLRQVTVNEKLVNIRSGPGLDTSILGRAVSGQVVDVIGAAPEWLYIRTASGQYGWIMSRYTTEVASPVG